MPSRHGRRVSAVGFAAALMTLLAVFLAGCNDSQQKKQAQTPASLRTRTHAPIAFVRSGRTDGTQRLVLTDPDGSHVRDLWHSSWIVDPAWSPDGRQLAVGANNYSDIFVMNADGSSRRRLTHGYQDDLHPAWSPDGKTIVFDRNDDGDNAIWTVTADGKAARRLTPGHAFGEPSWSPDARRIVFTDRGSYRWILVMNADGSDRRHLVRGGDSSEEGGDIVWSPNGKKIAFTAFRPSGGLALTNADGSGLKIVPHSQPAARDIRWSPDGRRIVLTGGDGDYEIFVVNADGSGWRRLTDNRLYQDTQPTWAPDGKAIAFRRARGGGVGSPPGEIYVMNVDGTGERNLTRSRADEVSPAWAPRR